MLRFFALRLADVRRETPSAISVAFDIPMRWRSHFRFLPGQYLTLRARIGGREVRRAYSICSGTDDGEVRIAIKRVANGLFSNHACDHFATGQMVDVMPPHGHFTAPETDQRPPYYAGIAAGSGITPVLSILKSTLAARPDARFVLFYGNGTVRDCLFHDALESLVDACQGRLVVAHAFSRSPGGGRVETALPGLLADHVKDTALVDRWFVCGPGPMMDAVHGVLEGHGIPPGRIASERFGAAVADGPLPEGVVADAVVTAHLFGRSADFMPGTATLAEGAAAAGVDLPYSCGTGVCAMCKARVVEGKAHMPADTVLSEADLAAGFILTCRSRAMTPRLIIDCDVD